MCATSRRAVSVWLATDAGVGSRVVANRHGQRHRVFRIARGVHPRRPHGPSVEHAGDLGLTAAAVEQDRREGAGLFDAEPPDGSPKHVPPSLPLHLTRPPWSCQWTKRAPSPRPPCSFRSTRPTCPHRRPHRCLKEGARTHNVPRHYRGRLATCMATRCELFCAP